MVPPGLSTHTSGQRLLVMNVCSLGKRLRHILTMPCQMYALSEVRASVVQVRSLSRAAYSMGFSSVWSASPPPNATSSVSQGGTAIFVKSPLVASPLTAPGCDRWRSRGRARVAKVCDPSGSCIVIIAAYGFPPGHQDRGANEEMFKDLLGTLTSLTCPSILVGDLNSTISDSPTLSLASMIGAVVLSPQGSSTTKRSKGRAKREPIDHVVANKSAVDLITMTRFEHNLVVSDHVPIAVTVNLPLPSFMRVVWPKKPSDLPKDPNPLPWNAAPEDYQQWQQAAKSWIQDATGVSIPERGSFQVSEPKWSSPKPCRRFCRLVKLRRAVSETMFAGGSNNKVSSILRKIHALRMLEWSALVDQPAVLLAQIDKEVSSFLDRTHQKAVRKWRDLSTKWSASSRGGVSLP